ncbi:MAG: alpha-ribazole phosphatase family protein [Gammaproteobacteria bacterium]|nr:alpha-ribazole phosphatase family protein [Gammaproteobacteria bacterium]
MSENITTIYLLRHGETAAGSCFLGATDAPLTVYGWQQMTEACEHKIDYAWLVSSPLKRCADFARQLSNKNNLPLLIENDLREIHFGDWEAKTSDELWQTDRERLSAFWDDPVNNSPPGGESLSQLYTRVINSMTDLIKKYPGQKILLIAHGGSIRCALAWALKMPVANINSISLAHGSLSCIKVSQDKQQLYPEVEFINAPSNCVHG